MDEPLVYTIRGNLPVSSLKYETAWDVTETYYKFIERYLDPETGEVLKESAHVYMPKGLLAEGIAGTF